MHHVPFAAQCYPCFQAVRAQNERERDKRYEDLLAQNRRLTSKAELERDENIALLRKSNAEHAMELRSASEAHARAIGSVGENLSRIHISETTRPERIAYAGWGMK